MNRMRDPWGTWGGARKRRSSLQGEDQPDNLTDDFNMFPNMQIPWDTSSWNRTMPRKQHQPPKHQSPVNTTGTGVGGGVPQERIIHDVDDDDMFFNRIPEEFRKYIPDHFDFPMMRHHHINRQQPQPQSPPNNTTTTRTYNIQPPHPQQQQQQPQPQQQPIPQQQHQQQRVNIQSSPSRRNMCDAAMQTDDHLSGNVPDENQNNQNLNSHGLRNTMDLGQKTADDYEDRGPRAQSAPPEKTPGCAYPGGPPLTDQQQQQQPHGSHAYASASAGTNTTSPPNFNQQNQQFYPRQYYYPFQQQGGVPQPQQQASAESSQTSPQPNVNQPNTADGSGFVRHVPIVLESRKVPTGAPRTASQEIPIQTQNQQPQGQSPSQQQAQQPQPPPQIMDHITKIRAIQQDVMELMLQIEKFKGDRQDKQYIWLDEMLTRNLIKLDDIETDGKDNIRLARREAIKCIQASLAVLEMKADEGTIRPELHDQGTEAMEMDTTIKPTEEVAPIAMDVDIKSPASAANAAAEDTSAQSDKEVQPETMVSEVIINLPETSKTDESAPVVVTPSQPDSESVPTTTNQTATVEEPQNATTKSDENIVKDAGTAATVEEEEKKKQESKEENTSENLTQKN